MGFRFRKSLNFGPFRINFSKSGIGCSFGGNGFRVTKTADGRTRSTASIPGTGISYVKEQSSKKQGSGGKRGPSPKVVGIVAAVVLIAGVGSCTAGGGDDKEPVFSGPISSASASVDASSDVSASTPVEDMTELPDVSAPQDGQEDPSPAQSAPAAEAKPETKPEPQENKPEAQPETPAADPAPVQQETPAPDPAPAEPAPVQETEPDSGDQETMVWIPKSGSKYHSDPGCSGMDDPTQVPLSQAQANGYTACKRCH